MGSLQLPFLGLIRYGGAYFDSDVEPGRTTLSQVSSHPYSKHSLFIEHWSQQPQVEQEQLTNFTVDKAGNDTFICTQNNPLLVAINQAALANYSIKSQSDEDVSLKEVIELAHMGKNIQDLTVMRTGPVVVQGILKDSVHKQTHREKNNTAIHRIRDGIIELAIPKPNKAKWLKASRVDKYPLEDALKRLKQTILFEDKHFYSLRLDDHITDLIASCNYQELDAEKALQLIIQIIQPINMQSKYYQLTGQYQQTIDYCQNNNLPNLFKLDQEKFELAVIKQAYLDKFLTVEKVAQHHEQARQIASKHQTMPELVILGSQTTRVKKNLCRQIEAGAEFMSHLITNIEQFGERKLAVIAFIQNRLEKYKIYGEFLNRQVKNEHSIDMSKINEYISIITQRNNTLQQNVFRK